MPKHHLGKVLPQLPHEIGKACPLAAMNFLPSYASGKPCSSFAALWLTRAAYMACSVHSLAACVEVLTSTSTAISFMTIASH